jgi:flagella basal body P-ring formation protein FlgA
MMKQADDHIQVDGNGDAIDPAAMRELIKPLVMMMHKRKIIQVVIDKDGGDVRMNMLPEAT